jgi:hypothetical protein
MDLIKKLKFNNKKNSVRQKIKPTISSISQIQYLFKFNKSKPFTVLECDKNIGSAIISNELYDDLVIQFLTTDKNLKK